MSVKENIRPGGRSARVQASVHQATRKMLSEMERAEITIPLIATEAGVTPSTIYRRWGDLKDLFADVAVERLQPDAEPRDTGDAKADLLGWAEQYADEMSSGPGRTMIRDVLATGDGGNAVKCCSYTMQQIEVLVKRAAVRGQPFADLDTIMDHVVAPIMYRILFDTPPDSTRVRDLVERLLPDEQDETVTPPRRA